MADRIVDPGRRLDTAAQQAAGKPGHDPAEQKNEERLPGADDERGVTGGNAGDITDDLVHVAKVKI